ncbi:MAG: ATP-binding cassette domain-containing protein, partial [Chromatiales bacterium]|nr:ATP-binding cassette domain-containing protein [Chromatiales bacterium]
LSQGAVSFCANVAMWLMVLTLIPKVAAGTTPPADLAMLALFTLASFEAVVPLPLAFQSLGETLAAAGRLFSIVDTKPTVAEPETPATEPTGFDISFSNVSFHYHRENALVLKEINLQLPMGRKIAVVGATGSGKSSLINLMLRFWNPSAGTISLGERPIETYSSEQLRSQFAVVPQHPHLFHTTIRENLLLAKPDATAVELEEACQSAQLHEFIQALPDGYDTIVGETGLKLSGGQAKRIAIARALLKSAPILILDEPTEGIDAATEQALMNAVYDTMASRTLLLISHRMTGLEMMDEIIVMEKGEIIERGSLKQLLSAQSRFSQLYALSRTIDQFHEDNLCPLS